MSYANQEMSRNRITALVIVALIHILLGYALVTGLAYSAVQQVIKKVTTVDIKKDEPKKPPPPPPPPPKNITPPPPIAPPVKINVAVAPPQIQTVQVAPPPAPIVLAPPAPVAPPAPKFSPTSPKPKGDASQWVTPDDYPARALRENRTGVTGITLEVDANGRATGCSVASSSGSPDLDAAACQYAQRRARFTPAKDGDGAATTGSYTTRVRWVVPKE